MTQRDIAIELEIDVKTLRNWKKHRPRLYDIVMKGFEVEQYANELKELYEKIQSIHVLDRESKQSSS